jgi:hypothetical protein
MSVNAERSGTTSAMTTSSSATENSVSKVTLAKEHHSFEHLARNRDAWQVRERDFSAHQSFIPFCIP